MSRDAALRINMSGPEDAARRPNPVDVHVGGRIRIRRKLLGVSQAHLAETLGLTFQQIQKYERGANRVSASKLYEIARTLQVSVASFFEGLQETPANGADDALGVEAERVVQTFRAMPEALELAEFFPQIKNGRVRRQILELVRMLVLDAQ